MSNAIGFSFSSKGVILLPMGKGFRLRRNPDKGHSISYILLFYSGFLLFAFSAFFQERIALFSAHPTTWMNNAEFYLCFAALMISVVAYLLLVKRNIKLGIQWGWVILFLTLFICNAIATFAFDTHIAGESVYRGDPFLYDRTFTLDERFRYVTCFAASCVFFYIFFAVFPKTFHNVRRVHFIWVMAILVVFAAITYSLIKEWDLYASIWTPGARWKVTEVCSFTNNPNTFALAVMLGIIAFGFLHNRRSHAIYLIAMVVLGLFQLLIGSGSGAIGSWVIIVLYFGYRFFATLKVHTGRNFFVGFLFLGTFITLTVLVFAQVGGESSIFYRLGAALKRDHFSSSSGAMRLVTWQRIFDALNTPLKWFFGVGDIQSLYFLGAIELPVSVGEVAYAHNGFFHQLLSGGLIRLGVYLGLIARFVYLCVKNAKKPTRVGAAALVMMIGFLVRTFLETTSFLSAEAKGICMYLMLVLPVEVENVVNSHPQLQAYEEQALRFGKKVRVCYDLTPVSMAKRSFLFLTPIVALMLGTVPFLLPKVGPAYYLLWAEAFLLIPLGVFAIGHHKDAFDRRLYGWLFALGCLATLSLGVIGVFYPLLGYIALAPIPVFTLIGLLIHKKGIKEVGEKGFGKLFLIHLLIASILTGLGCCLYFVPVEQASIFNPIMAMIGILMIYVAILYSPKGDYLTYPYCIALRRFDAYRTAKGILRERALALKEAHYRDGSNPMPDIEYAPKAVAPKRVINLNDIDF